MLMTSLHMSHVCGFSLLCCSPVYMCHIYIFPSPICWSPVYICYIYVISFPYADHQSTCGTFLWFLCHMLITSLHVSHLGIQCSWNCCNSCHIYRVSPQSVSPNFFRDNYPIRDTIQVTILWLFHRIWPHMPLKIGEILKWLGYNFGHCVYCTVLKHVRVFFQFKCGKCQTCCHL